MTMAFCPKTVKWMDLEIMDHWSYSVAGVEKRELFAFHLVAFTRAELGDWLVTLHDG